MSSEKKNGPQRSTRNAKKGTRYMKNQYFGDINDYRKYGLLRAIIQAGKLSALVAWMLTPDDGSGDGKFVSYLENPRRWSWHDPKLFTNLKELLADPVGRRVRLIEESDLLPGATYYSAIVPDTVWERSAWFETLRERAFGSDLVFLDPDNGLEVKSNPYGGKSSSKYLYWREVESLWSLGKSLLIYQHFIRENRANFTRRMMEALKDKTPGSVVGAFSTSHVLFLLALQPEHHPAHGPIIEAVQRSWAGQIVHSQ